MQNKKDKKTACPYCGKEFKRITKNHLDKHNVTYAEYQKAYEPVNYIENVIVKFFNEFYITVRNKYLLYPVDGKTYTIDSNKTIERIDSSTGEILSIKANPLIDRNLKDHLRYKNTIGIFFPNLGTRLIGFDLDIQDKEALNNIYNALTRFVNPTDILMSSSGGKGYHIDLFLANIIERDIVKKFYELILSETGLDNKQLELRGANEQGWKLPFGMHFKKGAYCGAVDEFGLGVKSECLEELLKSRTKANINNVIDAVLINTDAPEETIIPETTTILTDDDIIEFDDISSSVTQLESYSNLQENFIGDLSKIYVKGFNGEGLRFDYTFKIALFLKSHMRLNRKDTLTEMYDWATRCKGYRATEKEFHTHIDNTVAQIFDQDLKLSIAANEIKISKVEIKEILSIKCRGSLETKALRSLYYMMFLHSKAYSDVDGVFFMTLEQMQEMGAVKRKIELSNQIDKLVGFGKIYKYPTKRISRVRYAPGEYKLIALSTITVKAGAKVFNMCNEPNKCNDCLDRATDFLMTTRSERQQYRKGKCLTCPYNKR